MKISSKMFKKSINYLIIVTLLFQISFGLVGCSDKKTTEPEDQISISLEKTDFTPYEYVSVNVSGVSFFNVNYSGSIDGIDLEIYTVDEENLVFLMPELSSGIAILYINIGDKSEEFEINILAMSMIDDPISYTDEFIAYNEDVFALIETEINYLISEGLLDEEAYNLDTTILEDSLNVLIEHFNALSVEEQLIVAQVISVNRETIEEINDLFVEIVTLMGNNDRASIEQMKEAIFLYIELVAKITAPVVIGGLAGSFFPGIGNIVGAGIGLLVTALINTQEIRKAIALLPGFFSATFIVTFLEVESTRDNEYMNGISKSLNGNLVARNLKSDDKTNSIGWISSFVDKYNKFKTFYYEYCSFLNLSVPDFFTPTSDNIPVSSINHLSVLVLNNSNNVSGVISGTLDNIQVEFSTDEEEDQNFRFIIKYDDGDFFVESSEISALLKVQTFIIEDFSGNYSAYSINSDGDEYYASAAINNNGTITHFLEPVNGGEYFLDENYDSRIKEFNSINGNFTMILYSRPDYSHGGDPYISIYTGIISSDKNKLSGTLYFDCPSEDEPSESIYQFEWTKSEP